MDNQDVLILREANLQAAKILQVSLEAIGMLSETFFGNGKHKKEDFIKLIDEYGIHHNQIISDWNNLLL